MPENYEETITLAGDLHARPAGQLAVAAAAFSSTVQVIVDGGAEANAKSVLAVMQLGATDGRRVTVLASGADAEKAVATLIGILAGVSSVGE